MHRSLAVAYVVFTVFFLCLTCRRIISSPPR